MQTYDEPPTIENYHGHPFLASLQDSAADADEPPAEGSGNGAPADTQPAAATGMLQWASPAQRRSFGGGRAAEPHRRRCDLTGTGHNWLPLHTCKAEAHSTAGWEIGATMVTPPA